MKKPSFLQASGTEVLIFDADPEYIYKVVSDIFVNRTGLF